MLTEAVIPSPPIAISSDPSVQSDGSEPSDNLGDMQVKERCWAVHTPEGIINEVVTGCAVLLY